MNYKNAGLVCFLCAVIVVANSCARRGDHVIETWETTNQTFKVRVRQYDENASIVLPHYYYTFEASAPGSDQWREIMTVRTDDAIAIPRQQVQFLGNQIAYAFMTTKYAVTTDAGHSWSVWDANEKLTDLKYRNGAFIKDAHVSPDGSGSMVLASRSDVTELTRLHTSDYGQHWVKNDSATLTRP
jgi:hypothetical protein